MQRTASDLVDRSQLAIGPQSLLKANCWTHCILYKVKVLKGCPIPSAGSVLREADRARTPESKVRVWSRSLDPIDSIGQLLSITVGRNVPAEGIPCPVLYFIHFANSYILEPSSSPRVRTTFYVQDVT